jgi:hypothetical protein
MRVVRRLASLHGRLLMWALAVHTIATDALHASPTEPQPPRPGTLDASTERELSGVSCSAAALDLMARIAGAIAAR